jgi:hypothetical protein
MGRDGRHAAQPLRLAIPLMARVLLISLFLFFMPFLLYGGFRRLVRKEKGEHMWRDAPIVGLALAGVALAIAGLIGMVYMTGM